MDRDRRLCELIVEYHGEAEKRGTNLTAGEHDR